jgi:hypothetical protein
MKDHAKMKSEFPSTALEAFTSTSSSVFDPEKIELLRRGCCEPKAVGDIASRTGKLTGPRSLRDVEFQAETRGDMQLWSFPQRDEKYVVAVDVGGLSDKADWSVIAVIRIGGEREVVAQWRGHLDHDLMIWKAAMIATYYNNAELVFESNTLESEQSSSEEAGYLQGALILHELYRYYRHLYRRKSPGEKSGRIPGFHTNRQTKQMIITELIAAVRDGSYIERCRETCDEFDYYERRPNGAYAAREGRHDDMLMTRAIGLHVAREHSKEESEPDSSLDAYMSGFGKG